MIRQTVRAGLALPAGNYVRVIVKGTDLGWPLPTECGALSMSGQSVRGGRRSSPRDRSTYRPPYQVPPTAKYVRTIGTRGRSDRKYVRLIGTERAGRVCPVDRYLCPRGRPGSMSGRSVPPPPDPASWRPAVWTR